MNYLDKKGTRELKEVRGRRRGRDANDMDIGVKQQIFPPRPPLEHISHNHYEEVEGGGGGGGGGDAAGPAKY